MYKQKHRETDLFCDNYKMGIFFLPLIPPRSVLVMGELKKGNGNVGVIYQLKLLINQQDREKRKCRERRG